MPIAATLALLLFAAAPTAEDLLRSGIQAMLSGNLGEARAALDSASRAAPSNPQVCLALTQLYARAKEEKLRAVSAGHCVEIAHAAANWESQAAIRNYLGKVYLANAEYQRAVSEYSEAIRIGPYEEIYRFDLAQALLNHEQFAEAAAVLEDAHNVFDKSAQIELALGVAYYGQRRFPEAINSFLRTIALAPEVTQPYVFLGKTIDQAVGRLPEVERRFSEFQKANPQNYLGYLLLAKAIAAGPGEPLKQRELLEKSIALNGDDWESHYELGVFLANSHEYAKAAQELERSEQLRADMAATHYHLARVYDRLNRAEAAAHERDIHRQLTAREKITAGMER